jgi:hypothetical protein
MIFKILLKKKVKTPEISFLNKTKKNLPVLYISARSGHENLAFRESFCKNKTFLESFCNY